MPHFRISASRHSLFENWTFVSSCIYSVYESTTPVIALMTVHNGTIICLGDVTALGHKKTNVAPCARVISGSEH